MEWKEINGGEVVSIYVETYEVEVRPGYSISVDCYEIGLGRENGKVYRRVGRVLDSVIHKQ